MTAYVSDIKGNEWRLPEILRWDMTHGMGEEADCYNVAFASELSDGGLRGVLSNACRFRAEQEGDTVFTGVVDEYETVSGEEGCVTTLCGRGLAALLMDNEARSAQYWGAGLSFILENHVYPWGITDVRCVEMGRASRLDVSAGMSQWGVLREFCVFCGGVYPRFDRRGTLLLDGSAGARRRIDENTAVIEQRVREKRYGVISEALIYRRGAEATVENEKFKAIGGSARRVINVPRGTAYDAMRYTGSYQIERSEREAHTVELTLAAPFAAFAGDVIELVWTSLNVTGSFLCVESRCAASESGATTRLTLVRRG